MLGAYCLSKRRVFTLWRNHRNDSWDKWLTMVRINIPKCTLAYRLTDYPSGSSQLFSPHPPHSHVPLPLQPALLVFCSVPVPLPWPSLLLFFSSLVFSSFSLLFFSSSLLLFSSSCLLLFSSSLASPSPHGSVQSTTFCPCSRIYQVPPAVLPHFYCKNP